MEYTIYTRVDQLGGSYCGTGHGWEGPTFDDLPAAERELESRRAQGQAPVLVREDGAILAPDGAWITN